MKTRTGYLFRKKVDGKELPTWYVRIMVDGKPIVRSTETADFKKAERKRNEILAPYALGGRAEVLKAVVHRLEDTEDEQARLEAAANPPPEIAAVWEKFLASKKRPDSGEATLQQYGAEWRRFAKWIAGTHPGIERIDQVTSNLAEAYAGDMEGAKMTPSTFNQHLRLLRLVWRILVSTDPSKNPWLQITPKKWNKKANRKHNLTPGQFEALLATAEKDPDLRDLFLLLGWTGLRLADGVLLKYAAVDFKTNVITVIPRKTARRNGEEVYIPIFPAVLEVLNRLQDGRVLDPRAYVFPALAKEYKNDRTTLTKRIAQVFTDAGMATCEERQGRQRKAVVFGAHSLRHHFVTAATEAGIPAKMIKMITGHSTDEMLGHYQQIGKGLAAELAGRIGQAPKQLAGKTEDNAKQLAAVRELLETATAEDWPKIKTKVLEILDAGGRP